VNFLRILQIVPDLNLAGAQTEQQYLTTGELHSLANCMKIGWHPRYKELLK